MRKIILGIIILVIIIVLGAVAYVARPPKSATEDIQTGTEVLTPKENESGSQNLTHYRISQDASEVEFNINEVLRGEDFTVVGKTNQIAGDILLERDNLSNVEVGTIRINARTLKTDNPNRDGAISRIILKSEQDQFEFIEFEPTPITGLPKTADEMTKTGVKITGNLTIAGATKEVTFNGFLNLLSEEQISIFVQTTVLYKDFNLTIPEVPFVASVEDEVILKANINAFRVVE